MSERNLDDILDPQVSKEGGGEVIDIALLAAVCVKFVSAERPTMRHVEMALEGIYEAKVCISSDMSDDESEENYQLHDVSVGGTNLDTMSQGLRRCTAGKPVGNIMATKSPGHAGAAPPYSAPSPNNLHSHRLTDARDARVLISHQGGRREVLMHGQGMWSSW